MVRWRPWTRGIDCTQIFLLNLERVLFVVSTLLCCFAYVEVLTAYGLLLFQQLAKVYDKIDMVLGILRIKWNDVFSLFIYYYI